jgi:mannose-6-phosphate isomerase class I
MADVPGLCDALYDELEEVIVTHATETSLTRTEAEVWAFAHSNGPTYSVLT